tara:strand:+ start:1088 stop:1345 length:258 start_codon:yes stop_codon:yes gene_type:complete
MKKITTNQWLIGGGIIALIYILYKSQQEKTEVVLPKSVIDNTDKGITDNGDTGEDYLKDVPKSCLKPFTVNGKTYETDGKKFFVK